MSRPAATTRLAALDPRTVADDVQRQCADHLARLAFALGYDARDSSPSNLHPEVAALVEFAQRGRAWDWTDSADAWDAAATVCAALYSSPADGTSAGELRGDADPSTPIGTVLVAIHARVLLDGDRPLTARQLAALGSVDAQHVRLLARNGELRARDDGSFTAREARRWLGARGVEPYATPAK